MKFPIIKVITWIYMFFAPITVGTLVGTTEMSITAIVGAIMLGFAHLDQLKEFSAGGMTIKVRQAVDEAYATIEKLRNLAIALSDPIAVHIALVGNAGRTLTSAAKFEQIKVLENALRGLEIDTDRIESVVGPFYQEYNRSHNLRLAVAIEKDGNAPNDLKEKMLAYRKNQGLEMPQIKAAPTQEEYRPSEDVQELIADRKWFVEKRELRRKETW